MRTLTPRIVAEVLQHEGLAREAYRDSVGVWTWSVGITDASGQNVARYRDNPQSIERCLEVYVWLLTARYLPPGASRVRRVRAVRTPARRGALVPLQHRRDCARIVAQAVPGG